MARPPITRANPYTPQRGSLAGITFTTERQYRNALARLKGFRSWYAQQQAARTVRTGADLARLRPAEREARQRALDAVRLMRTRGLSLHRAAADAGTTVNAVKRHAGSALDRTASGRYRATAYDRMVRPMLVPTPTGPVVLDVRDSRTASKLGAYWVAVGHYLETGDDRPLRTFRGKGITVNKRFYPFITDRTVIVRQADAGVITFDSIYVLPAA